MVRVSGVPYEVELVDMVSELERENAMMRARMERLEDENRTLDALVFAKLIKQVYIVLPALD
jgi:hypothetical protein